MLAIQDGRLIDGEDARIPVTDGGLIHGDGVFEVIRLYGGRPFALDEHLERMALSARNMRLPFDSEMMGSDITALLAAAAPDDDGVVRVIATRGGHKIAMLEPIDGPPKDVAVATIEYDPPLVLDGVKSLSYGPNMHSRRLAQEMGADEALLVSPEGHVLEGPTSSFFYAFDGTGLLTPPLTEHILDSITRRHLVAVTDAIERPLTREELDVVAEGFLASSVREVVPVRAIDSRGLIAPGPLTAMATRRMHERIASMLETSG